jgi:GPH family glycoside/pentoside/hexuronide:cation symporter
MAGLALMLTVIPGVFHILVGLIMFRYRVTDVFYNRIMAETKNRMPEQTSAFVSPAQQKPAGSR